MAGSASVTLSRGEKHNVALGKVKEGQCYAPKAVSPAQGGAARQSAAARQSGASFSRAVVVDW